MLVARQRHLCARQIQRVQRVQEFALRGGLVGQEVHVVDHQQIHAAHAAAEAVHLTRANGVDVLVGELLGRHVADARLRRVLATRAAEALQQVRLAHAAAAVHNQEAEFVVRLRHAARGVKRELVRGARHEFIETTPCV